MSLPGDDRSRERAREEIDFHLDMRVRELVASGMDADEARRVALAAFGDPGRVASAMARVDDHVRRRRNLREGLSSVAHDLRYGARFLKSNPWFTAVVVATLGLGIGATTGIFSLVDAALLRRPSADDPGSLVAVYTTCRQGAPRCSSSYPDFLDYRERSRTLRDLAASTVVPAASLGDPERGNRLVRAWAVSGNYFALLGVGASRGRPLQPADDAPGGEGFGVVFLAHEFWMTQFGGDPDIVGRSIRLNNVPFEVVGVAPQDHRGVSLGEEADLWVPLHGLPSLAPEQSFPASAFDSRGTRWIARLVGRLAAGSTVSQARDELLAVSEALRQEDPDARGPRTVTVDALGRYLLPAGAEESLPQFVWLLLGVVGSTLLLACANLANLLLARASMRTAEMGVRVAIGAGRGRLVRQLLAESLLLSVLGAVAGLALAPILMRALGAFELPGGIPISALDAGLDLRALAVTGVLAVATALLCGLAPALQATRRDVVGALRVGRSPGGAQGAGRLRRGLVGVQVALCLLLLVGSGLFVRSLRSALAADPGFRADNLAVMRFNLATLGFGPAEGLALAEDLRERTAPLPGVQAVTVATLVPFQGGGFSGVFTQIDGYQPAPDEEMRIDRVFVSPGYTETLGIPMLAGRDFGVEDGSGSAPVAVVNRTMAERYWPGGQALGGTLRLQGPAGVVAVRVVGIAGDVHWGNLRDEVTNFVFLPHAQWPEAATGSLTVAARTTGRPADVLAALRAEARALEPDFAPQLLTTMDELVGELIMPQRLGTVLFSAFGLLALLLAAIGIAGVVSYTVRDQRRSIGVRLALGARRSQVLAMVVRGMSGPVLGGLALGVAAAIALDDAVAGFLFGVSAGDPWTYGVIGTGLTAVAFVATLVPAREATRVDPLQVLKSE